MLHMKLVRKKQKQILKKSPEQMNNDNYYDKSKFWWKEQEEFGKEVIKLEEAWKIKKSIAWILIESNLQIDYDSIYHNSERHFLGLLILKIWFKVAHSFKEYAKFLILTISLYLLKRAMLS